jgi:hypothetical protein
VDEGVPRGFGELLRKRLWGVAQEVSADRRRRCWADNQHYCRVPRAGRFD